MHTTAAWFSRAIASLLLAIASGPALLAQPRAPVVPRVGTVEPYLWSSRPVTNSGAAALLAGDELVSRPGASFLCFEIAALSLSPGSYLELWSLREGTPFVITPASWVSLGPHTPYFAGDAVRIRLWVAPGARGDFVQFGTVGVGRAPASLPGPATLCGADDRTTSTDRRIGRMMIKRGTEIGICTAFLIGHDCLLTAGHCLIPRPDDVQVHFQVPPSDSNGNAVPSARENWYSWDSDPKRWRAQFTRETEPDWAVFHTKVNTATNKNAGEAQGYWFSLAHEVTQNDTLRVTGYGQDDTPNKTYNHVQQSSLGPFVGSAGFDLHYKVDQLPGNSGGPIIDEPTERVVGIVSYCGTCDLQWNGGTAVWEPSLQQALKECRAGLAVTAFEAPPVLSPGATVLLRAVVENTGSSATGTFQFAYYIDDGNGPVAIATRNQSLAAGAKYVDQRLVRLPSTLPASASCWILAWADKANVTNDPNVTDNYMFHRAPCLRTQANLQIDTFRPNAGRLVPGQKTTVQVVIRNAGTEPAPASWAMFYLSRNASSLALDDVVVGWARVPTLGPGLSWLNGSFELTIPECVRALVGTTDLGLLCDVDNEVAESNEANNVASWPVDVAPEPMTRHVRFVPNRINSRPDVLNVDRGREVRTKAEFGSAPCEMCVGAESYNDYYLLAWSGTQQFAYDFYTDFSLSLLGGPLFPYWFGRAYEARTTQRPGIVLPPLPRMPVVVYTHALLFSPQLAFLGIGDVGIRHAFQ